MENIRFVPAVFEPKFISRTTARRIAVALGKTKPSEVCCPDQEQDGYEDTFDVANFTPRIGFRPFEDKNGNRFFPGIIANCLCVMQEADGQEAFFYF